MIGQKVSGGGNKVRGVITWGLVSWGIVAWSAGCSDGVGPETGTIRVLLTDAPSDVFSTAEVWVSHIYLQSGSTTDSGAGETAGRVDLFFSSIRRTRKPTTSCSSRMAPPPTLPAR
jgi:hypothetical protein